MEEITCPECRRLIVIAGVDVECAACAAERLARNAGMRYAPWRIVDVERRICAFVERAAGGGWLWVGRCVREFTPPSGRMERSEAVAAALAWFGAQ